MAGLSKRISNKYKEKVDENPSAALDEMAKFIKPRWFIDRNDGKTMPHISRVSQVKKIVTVDGVPCPSKYADAVFKFLMMISGICTVRKASKKSAWPKIAMSHSYDDCNRHVLSIHGEITQEAKRAWVTKDDEKNATQSAEEAIEHGRLIDLKAKTSFAHSVDLNITFDKYGKRNDLQIRLSRNFWSPSVLWYGEIDDNKIMFEDIFEKYMSAK